MNTRPKIDEPFTSPEAIAEMVRLFESCELPYERWTHRAHLAVAASYLQHYPQSQALERVRVNIQKYNLTRGDPKGYHETITVLFMKRVAREITGSADLHDVVNKLNDCCRLSWLLEYYSAALLWSAEARATFVEPDRKPIDFL